LDFQVQIVDNSHYSTIFRVQLKGTESPVLSASGEFYSISLDRSTLNYYARVSEPILLVLCDLSVDLTATKNCPCFYVWINDELKRHRAAGKDSSGSDSLVVRVPVSNKLVEDLDLLPMLESKLRLHKTAAALDAMVEERLPSAAPDERLTLLENLATGLSRYDSTLLKVVAAPITSPWPEAPKGTFAWKLNEVDRLLQAGAASKAHPILESLRPELEHATPHEQAEYWFCLGRVTAWSGDNGLAANHYDQACGLTSNLPRYAIAWAEAQLSVLYNPDEANDLTVIKSRLTSDEPDMKTMLARVLAAEGDATGAFGVLASLDRALALPTLAIIVSMQGGMKIPLFFVTKDLLSRMSHSVNSSFSISCGPARSSPSLCPKMSGMLEIMSSQHGAAPQR
jgi:hypothetical protein